MERLSEELSRMGDPLEERLQKDSGYLEQQKTVGDSS